MRLLLLVFTALAALAAPGPWTPADYARTAWPGGAALTRDGRALVYRIDQPDLKADTLRAQLWQVDLAAGVPRRVAPALAEAKSPRPGPGGRLAFLGCREADHGVFQAYVDGPQGPVRLTRRVRGVADLQWRDAHRLLLAAEDDPDAHDRALKARKDDAVVVDDAAHLVPLGLWELDLRTRRLRRIGATRDRIGTFAVSPDGRYAVAVHEQGTRWEYDQREVPRTRVWDLDRGTCAELPVDVHQVPDTFTWAADGRSFYALYRRFTHPAYSQAGVEAAYRASAPDWKPVALPLAWDRGFGPFLQGLDGRLLACLEDGLVHRMAFLDPVGGAPRLLANPPEGNPMLVLADAAGTRGAALLSSARRPPQWYAVAFGPEGLEVRRRLTHLNPHLEGQAFARVEPYRVAGAEGPVEGLLYYPADYRPGRAYPLVLNPHGGPALNDRDEWNENEHHPCQLHAQAGAFVLQLNYSGSTGYGLAFAERLMGRYLGPELVDLEKAMTDLVDRGLVDPRRIGLTGWSNGAILGWALLADSPYPLRAASLGAGDVNFVSDWSNCQFGASFDGYYLGASLVDDPNLYWRRSILPRLGKTTTPTIIFHGERDREVPTEQSWQGYRFLQQAGKAPVRLVLFPGEGHEFKQPVHILRKLEEEMAWFHRYFYAAP